MCKLSVVKRTGSGFLWSSERQGQRELEIRDYQGGLKRIVVDKTQGFRKLLHVDEKSGYVSYAASIEPANQDIYRVSLSSGNPIRLTPGSGYHMASFGQHPGVYVLSSFSTTQLGKTVVMRIPETSLAASADQIVAELPSVATTPPFVPNLELTQVGAQSYRSMLVRPRNFQPGKKYPVLVHVYGGPHHNQVMSVAGMYMLDQWLADHGFIVFLTDGRGTPFRGSSWERAISGNFGDIPLEDQVESLRLAGQRFPELDTKRVGIFGWSFGGYMAALAVLRRPDVYSVGVAGAPVVDWHDYDTCYTERYLGLPQQNREGYEKSSLLTYAKELKKPLLLIHGTADDNVLFVHSLKLSSALFKAGKAHELLPLTGLTHMVPDPVVTERMWTRILTFLASGLGVTLPGSGPTRPPATPGALGARRPVSAVNRPH